MTLQVRNALNILSAILSIFSFGVAVAESSALAQTRLNQQDVYAAFPSLSIRPAPDPPGSLQINTFRAPRLTLSQSGFELAMYWNGIDDQTWPFTRLLDVLLNKACSSVGRGWSEAVLNRLYASVSLVPEQQLGGNRGSTFKKMVVEPLPGCRVELVAQGERWHTLLAKVSYSASAPTTLPMTSPGVFQYRWANSPPASEITAADVQHALIWARKYDGMVDGNIGPYTRRAISEWQKSKSYSATGTLTAQQTIELVSEGLSQRDNYGWAYLVDDSVGFTVGFPTKLATLEPPRTEKGTWTYVAKGAVFNLVVFTASSSGACGSMDEYFEELTGKSGVNFEITYKARKDDWFVVAGRDSQNQFYSRSQCRDQGVVTAIAKIATSQINEHWFLFTALSNSLSLRPILHPSAPQAAPRIVSPALRPDTSVGAVTTPPSYVPSTEPPADTRSAPSGVPADVDRLGKTDKIRLALVEGPDLSAKDVFQRVSEAVFVVNAKERQGSAIAISQTELLTNCHVLGSETRVTLLREGVEMFARLKSANLDDDRCVLMSDTPLRVAVRARPFADLKVGERVFTVGAPQGLELTIAEGIVSSKRTVDGRRYVQTSAPISQGSSGGGLFDAQGHLVGITTFILKNAQNLNFAIAAEEYAR